MEEEEEEDEEEDEAQVEVVVGRGGVRGEREANEPQFQKASHR